jgi:hypothetical protein
MQLSHFGLSFDSSPSGQPSDQSPFSYWRFFGTIDNELYLYRLLSETLFMFLVGVALTRPNLSYADDNLAWSGLPCSSRYMAT